MKDAAREKGKREHSKMHSIKYISLTSGLYCKYFFFYFHMWAPLASKILVLQNAKFYSSSHATLNNMRDRFSDCREKCHNVQNESAADLTQPNI